ncbi:jg2625 [Pararge aegeria aegeria]|uniref:Jg2625 protein n=1 Tax=Pararge aegeria aegeria TaxID=348720 RepID=A0A8S4R1Y5_9NEOP|nr:jg2625 [Pararge aegeria aegeria]
MSRSTENRHLRDEQKKYATVQTDDGNFVGFQAEPFWRNRPELWFKKIEAQLSNCNIDVDTKKFKFVVSLLDEGTALEVKDVIIDPPDFDKYDYLKEQLIKRITAKNEREAKKRMMAEPMGDRKPSQFFCYLNVLAGCYVRDDFVEEVWLECLPRKIRAVVECLKDYTIDTQTKIADRVHEVFFSPLAERPTNTPANSALMECLVKEVEILNKKVQTLKPRGPYRAGSKSRDVQCNGHPTKPQSNMPKYMTQNQPCQYHTKYGVKLCKMRKNCN